MKLLIIFIAFLYPSLSFAYSHCDKGEIDYFSCELDNSKVASICGSPLKDPKTFEQLDSAWIQYRIGKINHIEFLYPKSKPGSISKFEGNYFHPHGEDHSVLDLRFINENALYSFEMVSSDKVTGGASAEINHKRHAHLCRGTIEPFYWLRFEELIGSISERNGQTDIFYEFYKKHAGK